MAERTHPVSRDVIDIKPRQIVEFPTESEQRFTAVGSALLNSESKCLAMLCLTNTPQTPPDLYRKFIIEVQGAWQPNRTLISGYCRQTLIPIGLVAEADTLYSGTTEYIVGFRTTEAGEHFGKPIAAFLLEESSKRPYSFLEVFGTTPASFKGNRSVLNTVKVLEFLAESQGVHTIANIARHLGMDANPIAQRLLSLSKLKLAEYMSINPEKKGQFKYTLLADAKIEDVKTVRSWPRLTTLVADLVFKYQTVDGPFLAEVLKDQYPHIPLGSLERSLSIILSDLVTQNICQRKIFKGANILSQASITPEGRQLVTEVLAPIKRALLGDESLLAAWRQIPWQVYARETVYKYMEASSHANSHPKEEWVGDIYTFICENPGNRPIEIKREFDRSVSDILKFLMQTGKVRKEKHGKSVLYYPNSQ